MVDGAAEWRRLRKLPLLLLLLLARVGAALHGLEMGPRGVLLRCGGGGGGGGGGKVEHAGWAKGKRLLAGRAIGLGGATSARLELAGGVARRSVLAVGRRLDDGHWDQERGLLS